MTHYTECGRPFRFLLAAFLFTTSWGCSTTPLTPTSEPLRSPPQYRQPLVGAIRTIVIDAGHGGHDPGASHHGLREKHLALDIARRLRTTLQDSGLTVVMTRETDQFIPLSGRPAVANRLGADLFVSVHINANKSQRVSGAEVYYPRVSAVSQTAAWPPSVRSAEVGVPSWTVKQILWDLVLGGTRSQSRRLASTICGSMRQGLAVSCKTKPARFVVLREAWMPSVLVEVGYVSNATEAQRLNRLDYRVLAAESIAQGIVAYVRDAGAQHI
ncbi:MAG: N-acetylmuramoyl-L-alanine amidase [Candidatus Omnitrophota bacterium]|nr:N-acetylmuramoyl-L-alanine amidase [Candidatus Omnitrophota bacterium]